MKSNYLSELQSRRSFLRQAACAAVGSLATRNCIRDLRLINRAVAQSGVSGYKALICVFQNGGNDSNNLIIPTIASEYQNYATIRTPAVAQPSCGDYSTAPSNGAYTLALKTGPTSATNYTDAQGHNYGFHPAMPELRTLFNNKQCAVLLNVGSLCYPITTAQYFAHSVPVPPQLFSHADQQAQWQTSIPDQPPTSGWAGRIGDLFTSDSINGSNPGISMAVTLAGSNLFEVGNNNLAPQYSVTTNGAVSLNGTITGDRDTAFTSILSADSGAGMADLQTKTYASVVSQAISEATSVTTQLNSNASASWLSNFPVSNQISTPNGGTQKFTSSLMAQMRMVARLIDIGARPSSPTYGMGMTRQIFFVQVGGYDTHTLQTGNAGQTTTNNAAVIIGNQANLLAEISQSMNALMGAVSTPGFGGTPTGSGTGLATSVTAFTVSDFARTFPSNGTGSDHGWGGHHVIVGGAVNGGATYGTLPVLTVGGPSDTGTGRWIPTTSVDEYAATLAAWFGVSTGNIPTIFPNINRFATTNLGFI